MADAYSMMFLWLVDSAALFVKCQDRAGFLCHILGFLARPGVRAVFYCRPYACLPRPVVVSRRCAPSLSTESAVQWMYQLIEVRS